MNVAWVNVACLACEFFASGATMPSSACIIGYGRRYSTTNTKYEVRNDRIWECH
ncbi:hypothetical protein BIFANG_03024 [Bifidobacterium angulatum DSM 20098 = JCM 7096]|uniref:Uncharacterized protein n=1 Tax=Bifidobacterium angulatum DSM 20098 = JCM 7096 TaxID=518635 RepID=C4FFC4_9BIFI|nr:hypothetical protein BIFANG_03024 [Bifidobacterium angulatum DSM 20098 = JCM 7096]